MSKWLLTQPPSSAVTDRRQIESSANLIDLFVAERPACPPVRPCTENLSPQAARRRPVSVDEWPGPRDDLSRAREVVSFWTNGMATRW